MVKFFIFFFTWFSFSTIEEPFALLNSSNELLTPHYDTQMFDTLPDRNSTLFSNKNIIISLCVLISGCILVYNTPLLYSCDPINFKSFIIKPLTWVYNELWVDKVISTISVYNGFNKETLHIQKFPGSPLYKVYVEVIGPEGVNLVDLIEYLEGLTPSPEAANLLEMLANL